jgi:hypothetical protein
MPSSVLLDRSEPAYSVLLAVPEDKTAQAAAAIKPDVELIPWDRFERDRDSILGPLVRRNDYPGWRVTDGLLEVLKSHPGAPVGLTWNGGVAFTLQDYEHARRALARYRADPAEQKRTGASDPAGDPVHPAGQFRGLIGDEMRRSP